MTERDCRWEAAYGYAVRGLPVIPLHVPVDDGCSCGRTKCDSAGKHPRIEGWREQASTDPGTIARWEAQWPNANVGIVTGDRAVLADGLVLGALDVDRDGWPWLARKMREHDWFPSTAMVESGSGAGTHFYLAFPAGTGSPTLAEGVEVKCNGRQVVAPPSLHASGRRYAWSEDRRTVARAPRWLLDAAPPSNGRVAVGEWVDLLAASSLAEGMRNDRLTRLVGHLLAHHVDRGVALGLALAVNARCCSPPLDDREVERIVASIAGREARKP